MLFVKRSAARSVEIQDSICSFCEKWFSRDTLGFQTGGNAQLETLSVGSKRRKFTSHHQVLPAVQPSFGVRPSGQRMEEHSRMRVLKWEQKGLPIKKGHVDRQQPVEPTSGVCNFLLC